MAPNPKRKPSSSTPTECASSPQLHPPHKTTSPSTGPPFPSIHLGISAIEFIQGHLGLKPLHATEGSDSLFRGLPFRRSLGPGRVGFRRSPVVKSVGFLHTNVHEGDTQLGFKESLFIHL